VIVAFAFTRAALALGAARQAIELAAARFFFRRDCVSVHSVGWTGAALDLDRSHQVLARFFLAA
jgi:hypothetical protein